nr:hypothetical protein GCM10017588_57600 [Microbispora rosea subsp. aerata]
MHLGQRFQQLERPPEVRPRRFEVAEVPAHPADAQRQSGRGVVIRPRPLGQFARGERMWPASYALTELTTDVEERITALVRQSVS